MPRFHLLPTILLCAAVSAGAQQQIPPPQETTPPPQTLNGPNDKNITISAVVRDSHGDPVPGLQQQDFKLLDNKRPADVVSFRAISMPTTPTTANAPRPPVQVVLVVDDVNSSFSTIAFVKDQLDHLFNPKNGPLPFPVSVEWLTDNGFRLQNHATTDPEQLAAYVNKNEAALHTIARGAGFYGAVERYQASMNALAGLATVLSRQPGRKLVIWLSHGWPLLSGPAVELSGKQEQQIFNQIVALSTGLRRANITLYNADPLGASDASNYRYLFYGAYMKGVKNPGQVQLGDVSLQVLSDQTGGRLCTEGRQFYNQIERCWDDGRAYYEFSFQPSPNEGNSPYHSLDVTVDKPGLKVETRTGYYEMAPQ